jgi:hypothetical protein
VQGHALRASILSLNFSFRIENIHFYRVGMTLNSTATNEKASNAFHLWAKITVKTKYSMNTAYSTSA